MASILSRPQWVKLDGPTSLKIITGHLFGTKPLPWLVIYFLSIQHCWGVHFEENSPEVSSVIFVCLKKYKFYHYHCYQWQLKLNFILIFSSPKVVLVPRSFGTLSCPSIFRPSLQCHNEHEGVSNHRHRNCLLNCLFMCKSKKISKLRVTGLCKGNPPVIGGFPSQRDSNVVNVSIWGCHPGCICTKVIWYTQPSIHIQAFLPLPKMSSRSMADVYWLIHLAYRIWPVRVWRKHHNNHKLEK